MSGEKKYFEEFRRVSEHVLKKKLRPISEEDELRERRSENICNEREDSSNDDYVFGNDVPIVAFKRKERQEIENSSNHENDAEEEKEKEVPLKRLKSRAVSEHGGREEKKPTKPKARYKKEDNVGNALVQEGKVNNLFKSLCEPSRKITVNSLGHTLQKFRIDFEVKDVVDMLKLHSSLANPNRDEDELQGIDGPQSLDLKASINEQEFKELYRMTRKKQKAK